MCTLSCRHTHTHKHTCMHAHTYTQGLPINQSIHILLSIKNRNWKPGLHKKTLGLSLRAEHFYGRGNCEQPGKQGKGLIWFVQPSLHPLLSQQSTVNQEEKIRTDVLLSKSVKLFLLHDNYKYCFWWRRKKSLRRYEIIFFLILFLFYIDCLFTDQSQFSLLPLLLLLPLPPTPALFVPQRG